MYNPRTHTCVSSPKFPVFIFYFCKFMHTLLTFSAANSTPKLQYCSMIAVCSARQPTCFIRLLLCVVLYCITTHYKIILHSPPHILQKTSTILLHFHIQNTQKTFCKSTQFYNLTPPPHPSLLKRPQTFKMYCHFNFLLCNIPFV